MVVRDSCGRRRLSAACTELIYPVRGAQFIITAEE